MPYPSNVFYSDHGERRRQHLGVRESKIQEALREGEIIETYPDTGRGPSYLLLHWIGDAPIHVVAADKDGFTVIVTVYAIRAPSPTNGRMITASDYEQR